MALRIAPKFSLPLEYQTHTAAILAQRRKGKTYLASVIAEEMAREGLPFLVLDPTGAWWGLRSSADGTKAGYPVVIIGGEHGDLPLVPDAGKVIADLVVDRPGFYVIDLSLTESQAEQDRFVTAFNKRLYRRKAPAKARDPLHIFIDEADEFAPQRADKGQGHLLSSTETLVRRGGLRGIGVTLISQRPAVINKNVLTQVDVMFLLRMTGKQDINAVDDWVRDNATPEQRQQYKARVTKLPAGTGWVWSPGWLECFEEIAVRERRTFNSSATPEVGIKPIVPIKLAPVDVAAISREIEATIERAKENDPSRLRQEVSRLKRELSNRPIAQPAATVERIVEVPVLAWSQEDMVGLRELVDDVERRFLHEITPEFTEAKMRLVKLREQVYAIMEKAETAAAATRASRPKEVASADLPVPKSPRRSASVASEGDGMTGVEQRIVDAIAWFEPLGIDRPSRVQVAVMSGYHERTKSFINALGALKGRGIIHHGNGIVELRVQSVANFPTTTQSDADLHDMVMKKLSPMYGRMLQILIDRWPRSVRREGLAEMLDYHERTKSFLNGIGRLRSLGLAEYPEAGQVRATDALFPTRR